MENNNEQIARILALTEETNKMVRTMRNQHRMSSFFRVVYIVAIGYMSWWGYQQLLPYLNQAKLAYAQITELNKQAQDIKETSGAEIQKLLDSIPKDLKTLKK